MQSWAVGSGRQQKDRQAGSRRQAGRQQKATCHPTGLTSANQLGFVCSTGGCCAETAHIVAKHTELKQLESPPVQPILVSQRPVDDKGAADGRVRRCCCRLQLAHAQQGAAVLALLGRKPGRTGRRCRGSGWPASRSGRRAWHSRTAAAEGADRGSDASRHACSALPRACQHSAETSCSEGRSRHRTLSFKLPACCTTPSTGGTRSA